MSCCPKPNQENLHFFPYFWLSVSAAILYLVLLFFPYTKITFGFYVVVYLILGWDVLKQSFFAVLARDFFNENTLMTIATLSAFFLMEYEEAVGVMLFYRIGEYIQDKAMEKSKHYIQSLFKLENLKTPVLVDSMWVEQDTQKIKIGEIILVKKGEKIPLDGVVYRGTSMLDTSSLTGESVPVLVQERDVVFSGTINEGNSIEIQVSKIYEDSSMQKLIKLIESANDKKTPIEKFITRFAKRYTPFVFGIAFLLTVVPVVFFHADWHPWLEKSIVFLVISCPCALILSTPLSFFCGIGICSKNGILVKSGEHLQLLTKLQNILLDKTGTITVGNFVLQEFWVSSEEKRQQYFQIMAMLESVSSHPIANAITTAYHTQNPPIPKVDFLVEEIPGKGLVATIENQSILVGSENFLREKGVSFEFHSPFSTAGTLLYLAIDQELVASALISDSLKPNSISVISSLQKKFRVVILSGDNRKIVEDVANKIPVTEYHAELLPENKVQQIENIKKQGITMFVGDGLNDAPSLAMADIGVAMGQRGTAVTTEVADIIIIKDDLEKILQMIKIAHKTVYIAKQNITIALITKILLMGLAFFSLANIWGGILADVGVTLLTILNCLRIFKNSLSSRFTKNCF